ncbi:type VII secretion protein EccB, partial [Micromonospora chokoriensis]
AHSCPHVAPPPPGAAPGPRPPAAPPPPPGATGGAVSVVTDLGRRYVLADREVLPMLGYGGVRPLRLPAGLVSLVPAGATLDPAAARAVAAGD